MHSVKRLQPEPVSPRFPRDPVSHDTTDAIRAFACIRFVRLRWFESSAHVRTERMSLIMPATSMAMLMSV